jgi:hypothetical protein
MSLSKLFSLFALVSLTSVSVAACAANTDATDEGSSSSADEDLKKSITSCNTDDDCVAVPKGGCCDNGWLAAVNKHHTKAYENATKCTEVPHPMCPMYMVHDTRVAECNTSKKQCEMVDAKDAGPSDCRSTGCAAGSTCQICWANYACVPNGAVC